MERIVDRLREFLEWVNGEPRDRIAGFSRDLLEWARSKPWRASITVAGGVLLGAGFFFVMQIVSAIGDIPTDPFDPDAAEAALAERTADEIADDIAAQIAAQEAQLRAEALADAQRALTDQEIQDLIGDLVAENVQAPFVVPNTISPALPDEMFTSILLIGNDESGFLADTIIFVLLPSDGSAPMMVSLPRDLYLTNRCTQGYSRINSALGGCSGVASGAELMSLTVQDFTGIEVDHFARVNFGGFASVVDQLGGTSVCVGDRPIRDEKSGLNLDAGCHTADGQTTLAWVRSRNPEFQNEDGTWVKPGGSDFDRQRKQQDTLFQLADRLGSASSIGSLSSIISGLASVVRTDSGWSVAQMAELGFRYRGINSSSVNRLSIPIQNYRTSGGAQVLIPAKTFNEVLSATYATAAR